MYSPKIAKTPPQALDSLRRTSAKMERCKSDVRRSLYRFGIDDKDEQDEIIAVLVHEKFIDERRYASAYTRDKLSQGRWGAAKIIAALKAKNIPKEIIDEAIAENVDRGQLADNLEATLTRQAHTERKKGVEGYALRVKLFRRAASRGHDFEDINDILNRILDDEDF